MIFSRWPLVVKHYMQGAFQSTIFYGLCSIDGFGFAEANYAGISRLFLLVIYCFICLKSYKHAISPGFGSLQMGILERVVFHCF